MKGRPLRLLQIVTRRQLRGAEVFAGDLCEALTVAGHAVTLAALYPAAAPALEPAGVTRIDLTSKRPRAPLSPALVVALARLLRRLRPDLIQANGSDTLKYSVLARRLGGLDVPLVYRNISIGSRWLRGPLHRAWQRRLLHATDHVVAVSRSSRDDLLATHGLDPRRVTVLPRAVRLPDAVPPGAAERLRALAGFAPEAPVVVHVGSLTREKNHALLLAAFAHLTAALPAARLVCFGDGPLAAEIAAAAEVPGLAGRVHLAGARPDAADLAAGADVLALTSDVEGMPGVVLEAGARARAVVATDVGGVSEVIDNGVTGLLVPPGDAAALTDALAALLADPERRRTLGEALRRRVAAEYALPRVVERYEDLYRRLVGEDGDG